MWFTLKEDFLEINVSEIVDKKHLELNVINFEHKEEVTVTVSRDSLVELKGMLAVLIENTKDM